MIDISTLSDIVDTYKKYVKLLFKNNVMTLLARVNTVNNKYNSHSQNLRVRP